MTDIIKVFDIGTDVNENELDEIQRENILKIFGELTKESHLIITYHTSSHKKLKCCYFDKIWC